MRPYGQPTLDHLVATGGIDAQVLIEITARNTATGSLEQIALWSGHEDRVFSLGGAPVVFTAAGDGLDPDPNEYAIGIDARRKRVRLTGLPGAVESRIRGLDLRAAPYTEWRVLLAGGAAVDAAHRLFKGFVDGVTVQTGAERQAGGIEIEVASSALMLQYSPDRRWSDALQRRRNPNTIAVGTPVLLTAGGTHSLDATTQFVDIEIVGGGGGGAASDGGAGSPGGASTALLSVTGTTWTGYGGTGGRGYSYTGVTPPGASALTPHGDGGDGGTWTNPGDGFDYVGNGGGAGQYLRTGLVDVAGHSGGNVAVVIGAGGAGGVSGPASGSAGNAGAVRISEYKSSAAADGFFRYAATAGDIEIQWA